MMPPESPACPYPSLRDALGGEYHIADLSLEIEPGHYIFEGRDDYWVKMKTALRCNAKSIEDDTLQRFGDDLVQAEV